MRVCCETIWITKVQAQISDLLNENGIRMRKMRCQTIWTTKVEAQICDLLNESGIRMRVGCQTIWTTKVEAQIYNLLNQNDTRMRDMGCQTIWITKVEAQICDLLNERAFGCVWVVQPYEPLRLKHIFIIYTSMKIKGGEGPTTICGQIRNRCGGEGPNKKRGWRSKWCGWFERGYFTKVWGCECEGQFNRHWRSQGSGRIFKDFVFS